MPTPNNGQPKFTNEELAQLGMGLEHLMKSLERKHVTETDERIKMIQRENLAKMKNLQNRLLSKEFEL